MKSFKTHGTKEVIRDRWCRIILESFGNNLTYLGLPAKEALDVLNWLGQLNEIVAFQCNDHKNDKLITWDDASQLQKILLNLERTEQIKSFSFYKGFLETVIIRGRDADGKSFDLKKPIHVYNLDFCNNLTSPLKTFDRANNPVEYYKLEAVAKLLEIQRDLNVHDNLKNFIMFLTVHADINEVDLMVHRDDISSGEYQTYFEVIDKLTKIDKKIRLVKLSMLHFLKNLFCSRSFVPHFYPPIFYQGTGGHKLLTFTIKGTFERSPVGSAKFKQDMLKLLNSKFILANKSGLHQYQSESIAESDISLNALEY